MSAIERREQAAARYRPQRTRVLFVAEAPPDSEDRYFYFEEVYDRDYLWLALMKALYGEEFHRPARERTRKAYWLRRFQEDGCQLIDAVKEPLSGGHSKRVRTIRAQKAESVSEAMEIDPRYIVLIKSTVWQALAPAYRDARLRVVNEGPLPFPSSGRQRQFHDVFRGLVENGRLALS
jgi:hypothetical protein